MYENLAKHVTMFAHYQETVTFQVIFTTDGQSSYAFYNYKQNEMKLKYSRQFIGLLYGSFVEGLEDSSDGSFLRTPDKNLVTCKSFLSYPVATY